MRIELKKLLPILQAIMGSAALSLLGGRLFAICPSSCTLIPSGPVTFCRCMIYETPNDSDRIQLVTDRTYSMLDVDGDGETDIPFGIYARGRAGSYVLKRLGGGIPGIYTEVRISDAVGYGMTPIGDINGDGVEDFAVASRDQYGDVDILTSPGSLTSPFYTTTIFDPGISTPNSIIGAGGYVFWSDYDGSVNMYDIGTSTHYSRNDGLCGDGIARGDFNGDGYIDVACSNYRDNIGLRVYYFDGSSFSPPVTLDNTRPWQGITAYDINGDGRTDIVSVGTEVSVWLNNGSSWTEVSVDDNLATMSGFYPPFSRVALAGMNCDSLIDIVVATSCPVSGGPSLVWYENLGDALSWAKHPIEYTGNYCFNSSTRYTYPYGLRVGFLEGDGIDIVIVRNAPNQLWGYFTDTCGVLGWDDPEDVEESPKTRSKVVQVLTSRGYLTLGSPTPVYVAVYDVEGRRVSGTIVRGEKKQYFRDLGL